MDENLLMELKGLEVRCLQLNSFNWFRSELVFQLEVLQNHTSIIMYYEKAKMMNKEIERIMIINVIE